MVKMAAPGLILGFRIFSIEHDELASLLDVESIEATLLVDVA